MAAEDADGAESGNDGSGRLVSSLSSSSSVPPMMSLRDQLEAAQLALATKDEELASAMAVKDEELASAMAELKAMAAKLASFEGRSK